MSFTGDLEHLPIVDIIQLLHATKKSGTLTVCSERGESQLVFRDGYVVSANHANDSLRIGRILVGSNAVSNEALNRALQEQTASGAARKPLIALLVEQGAINRQDAFKALETLIEMTIVEILTWTIGTFSLDVDHILVSDEYRYFPEKLQQEFSLNTQNLLMDALRIYDEKKRDGLLEAEFALQSLTEAAEAGAGDDGAAAAMPAAEPALTAEDLGLDDLDQLERKIPDVFTGLQDADGDEAQRRKVQAVASGLAPEDQEKLLTFLKRFSGAPAAGAAKTPGGDAAGRTVLLYSSDVPFREVVTGVCRHEGIAVFATNEEQYLDHILDQSMARGVPPVLVLDTPDRNEGAFSAERVAELRRQKRERYPQLVTIQLASPQEFAFSLQALADGVRAVIPRPLREERTTSFVDDTIGFLEAFPAYVKGCAVGDWLAARLGKSLLALEGLREAPEATLGLLQFVAGYCDRALTLIVSQAELVAERGIGIGAERSDGVVPVPPLRIPLTSPSLLQQVTEQGRPFFGDSDDRVLCDYLFAALGAPRRSTVLLLPMRSRGRTVALTYGDFGEKAPAAVPLELLTALAGAAALALENAFYRKRLEKAAS